MGEKAKAVTGQDCPAGERLRRRIVMHRQFVERSPFELHVASDADFAEDLLV